MEMLFIMYAVSRDTHVFLQSSRNTQGTLFKPPPLTVEKVFKTFKQIAADKGQSVRAVVFQSPFALLFVFAVDSFLGPVHVWRLVF